MKFRQISGQLETGGKISSRRQTTGVVCLPLLAMALAYTGPAHANCKNTVSADVVALDQVFFYNRLGAMNPAGMIYALKSDVVDLSGGTNPGPGNAMLRPDHRPRPLTLRVNEGDCLQVHFTNWLSQAPNDAPATRTASFHVMGMQPKDIISDASNVGNNNPSGLVAPGGSLTYTFFAEKEGTFLAYSAAAMTGGEGDGGSLAHGLFGAVNVENQGAEWYRSQVTEQDLALAATSSTLSKSDSKFYPVIDYQAVYPQVETRKPQEKLRLAAARGGRYKATMSRLTSNIGFIPGDKGKTLITGDFKGTIKQVKPDGSAVVAPTTAVSALEAAPYSWRIEGTAPHPQAGRPILSLLDSNNEIVHADIHAIITGPNRGKFSPAVEPKNAAYPDRLDPFREFTVVFHDEIKAVQAFPDWFNDPVLRHTLAGVRDFFAINYGTGGVGSEIIANRLGLGPMKDCVDCKYEEFFLTSWVLGDPAMVVDVPAGINAQGMGVVPNPEFATKAFFPADPSNVNHSYLNDRVKFRNLHAGPKEHHIFHLHAHQWLHTPDSDNSTYLDSQSIGPGSGYTYEIAYHGSGNRNRTAGDSIFHCHFYPHFAGGMWSLWRVHDVLETGTVLDADGKPAPGARALPDREIRTGTPIPAVVPVPTMAMAPQPGAKVAIEKGQVKLPEVASGNPGYPFFIPGIAGHRPPQPPLDMIADGGLPRHVIADGKAVSEETRLSFDKTVTAISAIKLPADGTLWERQAMIFHGGDGTTPGPKAYSTPKPEGGTGAFKVNGLPAKPGAPYADPCVSDNQQPTGKDRFYHGAVIQLDVKMNKVGWHFPQQRILTLRDDVEDTLDGIRPPEPLFMRANTGDCITYHHTNLVPHIYEQDEFQVTTPTDTIGQHIHLVKFDVTSSDGSGNGWNYEDGTFSPQDVLERLTAINAPAGDWQDTENPNANKPPVCNLDGFQHGYGTCVQTTVQRWFADDLLNNAGEDRTLRTVKTHDHFGPSTHQQVGLYAGLAIEPANSVWKHNETGEVLGGRADGGPTTWQAIIEPKNGEKAYREFLLHQADFSLAYRNDETPVNPPAREEAGLHDLLRVAPTCPGGEPRPCPEAISADDPGTMTVNYRNEPLALRVNNGANDQTPGRAGDLSFAFESRTDRAIPALNSQPDFFEQPLTRDVLPGDPFTPLLKTFAGDKVQIRVITGAHEEGHNFSAHGLKWLFEPSLKDSGFRNSQMMGISEHFEFEVNTVDPIRPGTPFVDLAYFPGAATDDLWNGLWGIMRTYNDRGVFSPRFPKPTLAKLPSNPEGTVLPVNCTIGAKGLPNCVNINGVCPVGAPQAHFKVHAFLARDLLRGPLVYNQGAGLEDPGAILFVRGSDLNATRTRLKPGVPVEPLILRARAGDCINLTLHNHLPKDLSNTQQDGWSTLPMIVEGFNNNDIRPSSHIGLTPQLVEFDTLRGAGLSIGQNWTLTGDNRVTAAPGKVVSYRWYAGRMTASPYPSASSKLKKLYAEPVEYGAVNLMPSDRIKQISKGAIGALIIEPQGAKWQEDANMRASATVTLANGKFFREHVLMFQDDLNLQQDGVPVPNLAGIEDPEDTAQKGFNYRTEPLWTRMNFPADTPLEVTRTFDFTDVLTGEAETPTFLAKAGEPVRLRVLQAGGHARNHVFQQHGHIWLEEPFINGSTVIGTNGFSEWQGSQSGIGAGSHFNFLLANGAGGVFATPGDYLYRDQASFTFDGGMWGKLRVQ